MIEQPAIVRSARGAFWPILGGIAILATLEVASVASYVLAHSLAEIFAVVISCAAFTLTWNTRRFLNNNYLLMVGCALFCASSINILHLLSYKGMGLFAGEDANLPTQLWLARRYLESIAFLCAPLFFSRRLRPRLVLALFGAAAALLLIAIFAHVFPTAYVEGLGSTPFKKVSEYIIAGLFLAAAWLLYRGRAHFDAGVAQRLVWSLIVSAGAELLFTLYVGVYDPSNRLGHFLTIIAYYLVYAAIVRTGIVKPYALLSQANTDLRSTLAELEQAQAAQARQSQWLSALHEIDRAILSARSPEAIAQATARLLVQVTGGRRATVNLFDFDASRRVILGAYGCDLVYPAGSATSEGYQLLEENRAGRVSAIKDVATAYDGPMKQALLDAGIRSVIGVPLVVDGKVIGAITMSYAGPGPQAQNVLDFLCQVADQLALGLHNARLNDEIRSSRQQLRILSHHLVELQEEERKSLSRELHDRAGQSLTALKLHLALLRREAEDAPAMQAGIDVVREMADNVMAELHELAVGLRPASLDRSGLLPALEQLVATFRRANSVEVELMTTGLGNERLPDELETALYRIVQEALTNVARHAGAQRVGIILSRRSSTVNLILEDDGQGFDVAEALRSNRLGLLGMRERAEMLGGTLTIESTPGPAGAQASSGDAPAQCGTAIFVEMPIRPGAARLAAAPDTAAARAT